MSPDRVRLGLATAVGALLVLGAPHAVRAQPRLVLQGIADGELWLTDSGSVILARHDGRPAAGARLTVLPGLFVGSRVQALATIEAGAGPGTAEDDAYVRAEVLLLRVIPARWLVVDAGRFPTPVGAFANRRLAPVNPLIGAPAAYPISYPWGGQVHGTAARVDYRVAVVNGPYSNEREVGEAGTAWRPALGAGVTLMTGLRIGASATWGPYLSDSVTAALPAGTAWQDYGQVILALDGQFSLGYFEARAEVGFSRYEVPTAPSVATGTAYHAELKYTWTPRVFTAVRLERSLYPFIRPVPGGGPWINRTVDSYNGELGVGVRLARGALLKASGRKDHWPVDAALKPFLPDGYALALQFSYWFDVADWTGHRY